MTVKTLVKYVKENDRYIALLELMLLLGLAYLFRVTSLLHLPIITSHISNFVGSALLMLIFIGPRAFRKRPAKRFYVATALVVALNVFLEFSKPIQINTPDFIDALYGITGVLLVYLVNRSYFPTASKG